MMNLNIEVLNTITPEWPHNVHPRQRRSDSTITIGLMGQEHYVALDNAVSETRQAAEERMKRQALENKEDRIPFEHTSKLCGIPYDTLLQPEQVADQDSTFSLAPGEHQKPCPFLTEKKFEELANPAKYPFGRGGLSEEREKKSTPRKYFNQRLLNADGRFASDIDQCNTRAV